MSFMTLLGMTMVVGLRIVTNLTSKGVRPVVLSSLFSAFASFLVCLCSCLTHVAFLLFEGDIADDVFPPW